MKLKPKVLWRFSEYVFITSQVDKSARKNNVIPTIKWLEPPPLIKKVAHNWFKNVWILSEEKCILVCQTMIKIESR